MDFPWPCVGYGFDDIGLLGCLEGKQCPLCFVVEVSVVLSLNRRCFCFGTLEEYIVYLYGCMNLHGITNYINSDGGSMVVIQ